ncbi:liprin-beta-1 isoform X3 [Frankliniella occidentalis]|uniref:Liprin-beta-1 isoform X3 n=1 Tax=Frankliniella occidentalis TaxID=133901 RepID=A0A9C6WUS2_FRAOC|nr:liprin-beta-1 isoform X3 [Frankliniella occidentalis]
MVRSGSLVSDKIAMLERKTVRGAGGGALAARPPPAAAAARKSGEEAVGGASRPQQLQQQPQQQQREDAVEAARDSSDCEQDEVSPDSGSDSGSSGSDSGGSSLMRHVVGSQDGAGSPGADDLSMDSDEESATETSSSSGGSSEPESYDEPEPQQLPRAPAGPPAGRRPAGPAGPTPAAAAPYHWMPAMPAPARCRPADQLPKLTRDPAVVLRKPPPCAPAPAPVVNKHHAHDSCGSCGSLGGRRKKKQPHEPHDRRRVHSSHESLLRRSCDEDAMSRSADGGLFDGAHYDAYAAAADNGVASFDGRVVHGSLDRRRQRARHRQHRDAKSRSALVEAADAWCCSPAPAAAPRRHHCGHHCCPAPPPPPPCSACTCYSPQRHAKGGDASTEERIRRLQAENERLQLQTAVLSERIDVQVDKMAELEAALGDRKRNLQQAEDQLQREMLSRSSLETQKLELLSSVTELKRQLVALSRENSELRTLQQHRPPVAPRTFYPSQSQLLRDASPGPGSPLHRNTASPGLEHAESCREIRELTRDIPPPRTPPANYRQRVQVQQYHSLPRQADPLADVGSPQAGESAAQTTVATNGSNGTSNGIRKGVAFGKGFLNFSPRRSVGDRCSSTPNLADTERVSQDENDRSLALSLSPQPSPSMSSSKSKGIKKILGRMKRSGSGNLDDIHNEGEFRRGGVRATAGGRLGWSSSSNALSSRAQVPFAQWDREAISEWLCALGLEHCAQEGQGWIVSGAQLLSSSPHDLEKELGLKNPLHKKKLRLALQERTDTGLASDPQLGLAGHLDTCWVLRWLDDTGLPQVKDQFSAARIDGRMLHRFTMDDLAALHVTSLLHVASIRTGIQVLRDHRFDPNCLVRRSGPTEDIENGIEEKNGKDQIPGGPNNEVVLWTNHRVMEWLRVVDLAEYAPNLRGSGVHGGLMVHEPRFTAELLASLLSIPPSKTLLRRHLSTHFKELLGKEAIQAKRQAEAALGHTPLTPTAKIKVPKKSQFSLKRQKTKAEVEFGDLVCPLENCPVTIVDISSGDRGVGDGDSHSGRTSTV